MDSGVSAVVAIGQAKEMRSAAQLLLEAVPHLAAAGMPKAAELVGNQADTLRQKARELEADAGMPLIVLPEGGGACS